ncbi:MAG: hypothetical protein GY816_05415 [Cytophagales bacterium]|nr:hypothetical protein [Cytophagales bacterium]
MNSNNQNQIEAYLSGEMDAEQLAKFESEVHVNPELQQELNFQSEVIQGIGQYRKAQLVARLDAVNIAPGWLSFIQSSTVQYVGGAIAIALIGTGLWFTFQDNSLGTELTSSSQIVVVDTPTQQESEWNLPKQKEQEPLMKEELLVVELRDWEKVDSSREKLFNPQIAVPDAGDFETETDFVPEQAGEPSGSTRTDSKKSQPIEVELVESKALNVRYRYYEGKLYLYGKFKQKPYEILEINSATGRQIYLYHLDTFHEIVPSDKPVDLKVVTNDKLIQELMILRKTK